MKHLFLLFIFFFSVQIYAAENPYTTEKAVQNRKEYADAMARTHQMLDRSIAADSANGKVTQSGSASSTVSDGSKVTGGGKVTKPINPSAVSKTIMDRLGKARGLLKASLPSFLGSAALNALINGIGWVMDEGGKVTKPPVPTKLTSQFIYLVQGDTASQSYSPESSCELEKIEMQKNSDRYGWRTNYVSSNVSTGNASTPFYCNLTSVYNDVSSTSAYQGSKTPNPDYNPSAPVLDVPVTDSELEQAITNYITNNTTNNITNNIVNNAYSNDSSNGATSSDPSNALAKEGANDIRSAIDKASTANGSEPTSGGKKGYYMITDGTKTIEGYVDPKGLSTPSNTDSTSTMTNPDGSTSTTTGTSKSEFALPAFCDWASVMCDWYKDWKDFIKEEDTDNEQPQEPDTTVLDRDFDTKFEVNAQCPPNPKIEFPIVGPVELGFNKICDFFLFLKFGVLTASSMLACWIVSSAVRGGE